MCVCVSVCVTTGEYARGLCTLYYYKDILTQAKMLTDYKHVHTVHMLYVPACICAMVYIYIIIKIMYLIKVDDSESVSLVCSHVADGEVKPLSVFISIEIKL